ncbi:S8 family serine peptidase [Pauljensenia sp. 27098_8_107]
MTLALAAGAIALPAAPAHAADPITAAEQPHFAYYKLDQARAKGYTGKGVTIALLDGEVDTSAPELAGATIIDKTPCTVTSSAYSKSHGTAMASLLVSKEYGVAPDATLLSYRTKYVQDGDTAESDCQGHHGNSLYEPEWLINQAITDGAQIISISASNGLTNDAMKWAIARANALGVIVVGAAGNDREEDTLDSYGKWSGVVSVSAIDTSGKRAEYSSWGKGVTVAAVGGPIVAHNYKTDTNISTQGTSNATPLVAGFLALAKQKWPNATSNQLLQLLTHTARTDQSGWNKYIGYGGADPGAMVNTDPSQYPDDNPIMDKGNDRLGPTTEESQQYLAGLVDPRDIAGDTTYIYRGLDESILKDTDIPTPIHLGTSPRYHAK